MFKSVIQYILNNVFKIKTQTKAKEIDDNQKYASEYERIDDINFNAIFSNKLANYVINDSNLDITGENARVDLLNKMGEFEFDKHVAEYDTAMKIARHLFGRHAFRKVYFNTLKDSPKSLVNKALFVSWSVLLADFDYNKVKKSQEKNSFIPILGKRISNDDGYYRALSYGTNGRKNILKAFEVAEQIIKANINK